jgi:tRNA A37 methylthiotransferase MiaB
MVPQPKKIKFVTASTMNQHHLPQIQYILRTAYDLEGKHPDSLIWIRNFVGKKMADLAWHDIVEDQPDIICFGVYMWTADFIHPLAERIKKHFPHITLILGGPDVQWKEYQAYHDRHPYYDYIIYGDGEDAFVKLMDRHLENKTTTLDLMNVPNLIFRDKSGKSVMTKHEIYRGRIFTEVSALYHCEQDLARDVQTLRDNGDFLVWYVWEIDRGCPYNCSFCDWSSGLHHKVTRKKYNALDEVKLFVKYNLAVYISNANVGMYPDDYLYMDALAKNNIVTHEPSWAKNHKKNVFKIIRNEVINYGRSQLKLPVQSLDDTVLANIDRPGTSWPELKEFITDLRSDGHLIKLGPEIIQGLPGETRESIDHSVLELINMWPISTVWNYLWHILPNSPASDAEYQQKFQIKTYDTLIIEPGVQYREDNRGFSNMSHDDIVDLLLHPDDRLIRKIPLGFIGQIVWETNTSSWEQLLYQNIALGAITALQTRCHNNKKLAISMFKSMRNRMWEVACEDAQRMREQYAKFGVIPFYIKKDDRIWPYDIAFQLPEIGLAHITGDRLAFEVLKEKDKNLKLRSDNKGWNPFRVKT